MVRKTHRSKSHKRRHSRKQTRRHTRKRGGTCPCSGASAALHGQFGGRGGMGGADLGHAFTTGASQELYQMTGRTPGLSSGGGGNNNEKKAAEKEKAKEERRKAREAAEERARQAEQAKEAALQAYEAKLHKSFKPRMRQLRNKYLAWWDALTPEEQKKIMNEINAEYAAAE